MSEARRGLCALLMIAVVSVPLAGWVASEDGPISRQAGMGIISGFIEQLHEKDEEDDAARGREYSAQLLELSRDERRELREASEAAHVEAEPEEQLAEAEQS
jgi:hypothetical protein